MRRELHHPGAEAQCGSCQGTGYLVVPRGEWAAAEACGCVGVCPHCKDSGFIAQGSGYRAPRMRCRCRQVQARMRAFDGIRAPARHAHSTRMSFVPRGAPQTAVLTVVSKYLNSFDPKTESQGLVLYGGVGRGKTHLLVALLREMVFVHGVRARFVEFSHLLADLKAGFDRGVGTAALIDPLVEIDVLGIDELGKGRKTDFEEAIIDEIVSRRYNAMRPILATTNFGAGAATGQGVANAAAVQLKMDKVPNLADRVGPRVYSRLRDACDFVGVTGEDYRVRRRRR